MAGANKWKATGMSSGSFPYCVLCGAHTRVSLCRLKSSCPSAVTSVAMGRALERLKQGLHPTKLKFLGMPSPFTSSTYMPQVVDSRDEKILQ